MITLRFSCGVDKEKKLMNIHNIIPNNFELTSFITLDPTVTLHNDLPFQQTSINCETTFKILLPLTYTSSFVTSAISIYLFFYF